MSILYITSYCQMATDDGDILFDFDTYEEFKTERLKLNYENTLQ